MYSKFQVEKTGTKARYNKTNVSGTEEDGDGSKKHFQKTMEYNRKYQEDEEQVIPIIISTS